MAPERSENSWRLSNKNNRKVSPEKNEIYYSDPKNFTRNFSNSQPKHKKNITEFSTNTFFFHKATMKSPEKSETKSTFKNNIGLNDNHLSEVRQKEIRLNGGFHTNDQSKKLMVNNFAVDQKINNIKNEQRFFELSASDSFYPRGTGNIFPERKNDTNYSKRLKTDFSFHENMFFGDNTLKPALHKREIMEKICKKKNTFVSKKRSSETTLAYKLSSSCGRFTKKPHDFGNIFIQSKNCECKTQRIQKKFDFSNQKITRYETSDSPRPLITSVINKKENSGYQSQFYDKEIKKRQN